MPRPPGMRNSVLAPILTADQSSRGTRRKTVLALLCVQGFGLLDRTVPTASQQRRRQLPCLAVRRCEVGVGQLAGERVGPQPRRDLRLALQVGLLAPERAQPSLRT